MQGRSSVAVFGLRLRACLDQSREGFRGRVRVMERRLAVVVRGLNLRSSIDQGADRVGGVSACGVVERCRIGFGRPCVGSRACLDEGADGFGVVFMGRANKRGAAEAVINIDLRACLDQCAGAFGGVASGAMQGARGFVVGGLDVDSRLHQGA